MTASDKAPSRPGFIDQVRDFITRVFGWPKARARRPEPLADRHSGEIGSLAENDAGSAPRRPTP
ncbi:MAG: hypothetical protein EA355_13765 [Rhodobacteraceae bacterium]|nr:MAG: hypothetical protein EA355_13765 [Paracoccaceae bacterium]